MATSPTLECERSLLGEGASLVIGCDEVGRGAVAGPVAVAVSAAILADLDDALVPVGLRDSKELSPRRREELAPAARDWLPSAVGLAQATEVDELGIIRALGLAAYRGLAELHRAGVVLAGGVVLLDGTHDWLTGALPDGSGLRVVTRPKADRDCATVSAASVVAKQQRDALMVRAHEHAPHYAWDRNKGYASAAHASAIAEHGPHALHRLSWIQGMLRQPPHQSQPATI